MLERSALEDCVNRRLSIRKTAAELGVSYGQVRYWLKQYNLETKPLFVSVFINKCKNCDNEFKYSKHKGLGIYCSNDCCTEYFRKTKFEKIETTGRYDSIRTARLYLIARDGNVCNICGISEWQGESVPLVCDHIDGNSEEFAMTNIRMICCNCDAQTPTYKGRNRGNGRFARAQRYRDGLSS